MTSQLRALRVLRTKPRRCAHHVYSTRSPRSAASSEAMRFSNPSPRSFENGKLFGSAQTRSVSRPTWLVIGQAAPAITPAPAMASTAAFFIDLPSLLLAGAREREGKGGPDADRALDRDLAMHGA